MQGQRKSVVRPAGKKVEAESADADGTERLKMMPPAPETDKKILRIDKGKERKL